MAEYLSEEDMNTGEYISRDDTLKAIHQYCKDCDNCNGVMCRACDNADAMDIVIDMPKADVQPVKRGKWKHVVGMNSKCSVCSHYFPVIEFDSRPFDINFCPNCGADMREKEGE